jgi:hypothetical protein
MRSSSWCRRLTVPFVDRGAKEQSLVGCSVCGRGFPLADLVPFQNPEGDVDYECHECWPDEEVADAE